MAEEFPSELRDERFEVDDLRFTEDDVANVLLWLQRAIRDKRVIGTELAKDLDVSGSSLHRWYAFPSETYHKPSFTEPVFRRLVETLKRKYNFLSFYEHEGIRSVGRDHLYFSMAARLQMWNSTATEMVQVLPGWYYSYRPSRYLPGAVVRGLVRFVYDAHAGPFRSWEMHLYRDQHMKVVRRQFHEGYVWRRRFQYIWDDQDVSTRIFRHTVLAEFFQQAGAVIALSGLSTASWSNGIYSAKVFLDRVPSVDAKTLEKYGIAGSKSVLSKVGVIHDSDLDRDVPAVALRQVDPRVVGNLIST
ncbi:MAG: hypothetical protein RLO01_13410 [Thalassobaculaceae bacterium]